MKTTQIVYNFKKRMQKQRLYTILGEFSELNG